MVTFCYKESGSNKWKTTTIHALEFIRRFLQHVLLKGFIKVRRYGFLSPAHKETFNKIQTLLSCMIILLMNPLNPGNTGSDNETGIKQTEIKKCPHCGGKLVLIETIKRKGRSPP